MGVDPSISTKKSNGNTSGGQREDGNQMEPTGSGNKGRVSKVQNDQCFKWDKDRK